MQTTLITDGDQRSALAVVRSLGRARYRCIVTSGSEESLAGASRYATKDLRVPDASTDPVAYVDTLVDICHRERVDLLIPVTEASLLTLLPGRERVPAVIPFARAEAFDAICDKGTVLEAARDLRIATPRQVAIDSGQDAGELDFDYPVVLKPIRSVFTRSDGTRGTTSVRWVYTPDGLDRALASYPPGAFPLLAQEAVHGPGLGVFVLLHNGRLLARFCHRRIREKPPSGGVSVLRQSEPMHERILDQSVALLSHFGWDGVAMVEYKLDPDGEPVLMEINGRFWGSLQLAIDAGVDFPRLLASAALEDPLPPVDSYRFVRSRWFWGDTDHLIAVWRDRRAPWRDRVRALAGWIRAFGPGYRSEVFRWTDPAPFFRETGQWLAHATRR